MKNNKWKKIIVPVVIAILIIIYILFWGAILIAIPQLNIFTKILSLVIPLLICLAMIYVTITRIKEIRSGEEDDLSKY